MNLYDGLKLHTACCQLDVDERSARLYNYVHYATDGGGTLQPPSTQFSGIAYLCQRDPRVANYLVDVRRLYEDADYRHTHLTFYREQLLPAVRNVGIRDLVQALCGNKPERAIRK